MLTSKVDDSNRSTVYTYTSGGRLLTRVWARTPAITTTYGYDANTAELLTVNYSDATPDVTFTYDRLGEAMQDADLVVVGVNSNGIGWAGDQLAAALPDDVPVLFLTKGMAARDEGIELLPRVLRDHLP